MNNIRSVHGAKFIFLMKNRVENDHKIQLQRRERYLLDVMQWNADNLPFTRFKKGVYWRCFSEQVYL
jgi:hypothetical protein